MSQSGNWCLFLCFRQREEGRKRSKRHRKKLNVFLQRLERELQKERKQKEKFKKRYQRLLKKTLSPRSKVNHELRTLSKVVRKRLLFHTALTKDLSNRYHNAKGEKERQMIAKICAGGKIVQKYRLRKYAEMVFGFSKKRWKHSDKDPHTFTWKRTTRTADALKSCVRLFFERDDVSRLTTGRKQTKTKSKLKNQKRFLMDTMRNVHR